LELNSFYQVKRDLVIEILKNSNFNFKPCKGTYFQLLDYSSISQITDMEFSEQMTKKVGVAVIPLSPFMKSNNSKTIRICFAKKDEVLIEAANKLANLTKV
jgi:methionine aminotransferase